MVVEALLELMCGPTRRVSREVITVSAYIIILNMLVKQQASSNTEMFQPGINFYSKSV